MEKRGNIETWNQVGFPKPTSKGGTICAPLLLPRNALVDYDGDMYIIKINRFFC